MTTYSLGYQNYFLDIKSSFAESQYNNANNALTTANYKAVLDFAAEQGFNGLRVPIVPSYSDYSNYSSIYQSVITYAQGIGLAIYASPLGSGNTAFSGWTNAQYATWVSTYANEVSPAYVSPFNEAAFTAAKMEAIITLIRSDLTSSPLIVGPDDISVATTVTQLNGNPTFYTSFDVISAHNDAGYLAAASDWANLSSAANGKPVWSTEDHAGVWSGGFSLSTGYVNTLCPWLGIPSLIPLPQPTALETSIASNLAPVV